MKTINHLWILCFSLIFQFTSLANSGSSAQLFKIQDNVPVKLKNPITVKYLNEHLKRSTPKLFLDRKTENILREKLKSDPIAKSYYQALLFEKNKILKQPLLTRKMEGVRLLAVSNEMVNRMGVLGMIYRIEKDPVILHRINDELNTVCNFSDWNPSHYLDVAEMSFAVSIAVDWAGSSLPKGTVQLAKRALIEKGILPSYNPNNRISWIKGNNNWNQVCHGGMVAAAITIADVDPELAAKTISRALDNLPNSLKEYGPDGIYPEGPGYWEYGTVYSVITSSMLTSAFGTDFGIAEYPAFIKSADFRLLVTTPEGYFFNYSDCDDKIEGGDGSILLSWFAAKTGNSAYLDKSYFSKSPEEIQRTMGRFAGPGLIWFSQYKEITHTELPKEWHGGGSNPLAIFRSEKGSPDKYFFGTKGGRASVGHGNMDAGSFVLDINGIRWVIDPGVQGYYELEREGFGLWSSCQDCQRWTLLTKSNFGHSTLTVDDARHNVGGFAPITEFKAGSVPEVTFDLTDIFKGHLKSAQRKFTKDTNHSLITEDQFVLGDSTRLITWAIMTTADVKPTKGGAILEQEGQQLNLKILTPGDVNVSVISLDPPPMKFDKRIEGLKRVEIRVPAYLCKEGKGSIRVRLFSQD